MISKRIKSENEIILSFAIPTFNRKKELEELVHSILDLARDDIDIVVTDNCSTDGTSDMLEAIFDGRLKVFRNEKPIPGLSNMIQGIFNCDGKYIFYCNDRDLIVKESIVKLIAFLQKNELSFVYTTKRKKAADVIGKYDIRKKAKNRKKSFLYKKGYDSLIHQDHSHHPTGMVFNGDIIRASLKKETYFEYLDDQYEYSFLMRDLLAYGDSAIFDYGCWDERPAKYLMKSKGKTVERGILYFYPETQNLVVKDTLKQTLVINDYKMTEVQKTDVGLHILYFFFGRLINYKYCMMDIRETSHYGIKRKFVSTPEMVKIFQKYFYSSINFMEENGFPPELVEEWERRYFKLLRRIVFLSCKADVGILRRMAIRNKEIRNG